METGKKTKYLKYAIGEIILVVIGILIALQINTWNEQRKLKQQESTYYCKIREDINSDLVSINRSVESLDERQKKAKNLLLNLLKIQEDKSVLLKDYLPALRSYTFVLNKSAINDITSSGKLENLKNEDLKNSILNYYSEQEYSAKIMKGNRDGLNAKIFEYSDYTSFGIHETPLYKNVFGEELQSLLLSTNWHKDPENVLFIHLKNHMNMTVVLCEREKQLLRDAEVKAKELSELLQSYCKTND